MSQPLPLSRRALFSALTLVATLLVVEGALSLIPRIYQWSRAGQAVASVGSSRVILCVGDSVTAGQGLERAQSYPSQLSERLVERGEAAVSVVTMARPAAASEALRTDVAPNVIRVAGGARPVALVMMGHNDFLDWSGSKVHDAFGRGQTAGGPSHGDPREGGGPRLLRLMRWFTTAWMGEVPAFKVDSEGVARLRANFVRLRAEVQGQGGELFVLTYVVPGAPPPTLSSQAAEILRQTADGQRAINRVLRAVAMQLGAPLIDAEDALVGEDTWSPRYFQDNIHLTAEGYGVLADLVDRNLQLSGWL